MKLLSPSSQPSPLKGEGGSGSIDPIAKGTSPEGEGFPLSPKGTLRPDLVGMNGIEKLNADKKIEKPNKNLTKEQCFVNG
jgi:hypothetical protein